MYPSQKTKYSRALYDYHSTSTNSTLSLTMAVTESQRLKDLSSHNSRSSKHSKKNQKGNTDAAFSVLKIAALVSPLGKGVVYLTGDEADDQWKDTLTEVDLTGDPGASNSVLNGSSNESEDESNYINLSGPDNGPESSAWAKPANGVIGSSNELEDKSNNINMTGLKDNPEDVPASTKPANGVNESSNELSDKLNNINTSGSKEVPEDVPALTTKPANGVSTELVDKSNYIDMSGPEIGTKDALASTKSLSNKNGVVQAGVVTGGSQPVQKVNFSGGDDMFLERKTVDNHLVNNTALNSGLSTQGTLAVLKKITPVWSIAQHKHRSAASVSIPAQIWKKSNHSKMQVSYKVRVINLRCCGMSSME